MSIRTVIARLYACTAGLHEEGGATAIEYGLIAALVVIAIIAALMNMNAMMTALYTVVETVDEVI